MGLSDARGFNSVNFSIDRNNASGSNLSNDFCSIYRGKVPSNTSGATFARVFRFLNATRTPFDIARRGVERVLGNDRGKNARVTSRRTQSPPVLQTTMFLVGSVRAQRCSSLFSANEARSNAGTSSKKSVTRHRFTLLRVSLLPLFPRWPYLFLTS